MKDLSSIIDIAGGAIITASGCSARKTKCTGDGCC